MSDTATSGEAVEQFLLARPGSVIGWVLMPREAYWVRSDGSHLFKYGGEACRLDGAFEIRLFDSEAEFRWWWVPESQTGRHATITDASVTGGGGFIARLKQCSNQLLWGRVACVEDEWVRLDEPRIGHLWVPITGVDPACGQCDPEDSKGESWHVRLWSVEYERQFHYGNRAVCEARMVAPLELVSEKRIRVSSDAVAGKETQP
jgi:CRISPR-associated protein (TIGR03984 family)